MSKEVGTYLVIKIGDIVLSTTAFERPKHSFDFRREGEKDNIWCKGVFTETKGYRKLKEPIPFELNIYTMEEEDHESDR